MAVALKLTENHLDDFEPRWFAVHTRFRSEKMAVKHLNENGIETYLPIKQMVRRYGRKIRYVEMPLINSFVFVRIKRSEYVKVLSTPYTAGFLKLGKNLLAIPNHEIDLIKRLLGENIDVDVEVKQQFEKGDWVEVTAGPLLGLTGKLVNVRGKERVIVELSNSGYSLQIHIENQLLKKIRPPYSGG